MSALDPGHDPATLQRPGDGRLTVACVYRTGSKLYSPRYVETLRDMVARHLDVPYDFVCLSDDANVACTRIPLITDWPGFYSKIELFRPGLFAGPVLYFDLDTVIHGNIGSLARIAREIDYGCVSDPLGGHMNSSVQTFRIDLSFIFDRFKSISFFDRHVRPHLWFVLRNVGLQRLFQFGSSYGDQGFSEMCLNGHGVPITHLDHRLPRTFTTYNFNATAAAEPEGSVCLMMGRPKPHEIPSGWIGRHWATAASYEGA